MNQLLKVFFFQRLKNEKQNDKKWCNSHELQKRRSDTIFSYNVPQFR